MRVISLINQKGGVGKTTLALSMASYWHLQGKRVAVLDADPQKSAMLWKKLQSSLSEESRLSGIEVYSADDATDIQDIRSLEEDIVIVDTAGIDNDMNREVVSVSDAVLIPVKPCAMDMNASLTTYHFVQRAGTPGFYVVSQTIGRTTMTDNALDALEQNNFPYLEHKIGNYVAFQRTIGIGETPYSENEYSMAGIQLKKMIQEFERRMGWA